LTLDALLAIITAQVAKTVSRRSEENLPEYISTCPNITDLISKFQEKLYKFSHFVPDFAKFKYFPGEKVCLWKRSSLGNSA